MHGAACGCIVAYRSGFDSPTVRNAAAALCAAAAMITALHHVYVLTYTYRPKSNKTVAAAEVKELKKTSSHSLEFEKSPLQTLF